MNKKIYLLSIVLLFTFNNDIHSSPQKELLKNLSLLYAGSGLGLWSIAHVAAKLSGAVPVYPETRGKNVFSPPIDHWESKDETESMVQKGLIKVANLFLKVSKVVAAPITRSAFLSTLTVIDFIGLVFDGIVPDIMDTLAGRRKGEVWFTSSAINRSVLLEFVQKPTIFLPIVAGFGGPLILQALYQKLQK